MSVGGSGLQDWLIQRTTAIILAVYTFILIGFWISHPDVDFSMWQNFFMHPWMKGVSILALISLSLHAWIGIWTVLTDYVHQTPIRYLCQFIVLTALFAYVVWGIQILYGVM